MSSVYEIHMCLLDVCLLATPVVLDPLSPFLQLSLACSACHGLHQLHQNLMVQHGCGLNQGLKIICTETVPATAKFLHNVRALDNNSVFFSARGLPVHYFIP